MLGIRLGGVRQPDPREFHPRFLRPQTRGEQVAHPVLCAATPASLLARHGTTEHHPAPLDRYCDCGDSMMASRIVPIIDSVARMEVPFPSRASRDMKSWTFEPDS